MKVKGKLLLSFSCYSDILLLLSSGPGNEKQASSRHCVTQARCRCWEKVSTDCSKLKCPKINGKKVKGVCSVEQPVTAVATDVYEDTGVQCRKE